MTAPASKHKRWTANDVATLLEQKWPSPAYVILREVRNGVGYTQRGERYADMLVCSIWPSRGISTTGIEIKVSRSDWRKEVRDPAKAEAISQYCHYWYVAAPKGVVPVDEVPETWGLIECLATRTVTTKAAPRREAVPPDWSFVASVMRGLDKSVVPIAQYVAELEKERALHEAEVKELWTLRDQRRELARLTTAVAEFERASGVSIDAWNAGRIGDAVKVVLAGGLDGVQRSLRVVLKKMDKAKGLCEQMCDQLEDAKEH